MARQFGNIRKLPSGRYQARYPSPVDGSSTPAPTTFTTKKAAAAYLAEVQTDIERGRWKSAEQLAAEEAEAAAERAGTLTIAQLGDVWMESIPSENHRVISASRLRRFINPELGDILVTELTRERCEKWHRDMEERLCPGAPTQRTRTYAALHAMLKLAVHMDLIAASPLRIKGLLVDRPAREPQTATPAEVDQLAAAMPPELSMFLQISAWCGLRLGEVNGLQIGDITVDRTTPCPLLPVVRIQIRRHVVQGRGTGSMTIVPGSKATGRTESVVVPPHLHVALWKHIEKYARHVEPQWVFPGTRTVDMPVGPATVDRRWRIARGKCDMEHLIFHDLRRTSSTTAAMAGATVGELKERLRHRSSEAAERYIVAARGADAELAHRMSLHAANPHRPVLRTEAGTEVGDALDEAAIDTVIETVTDLIERVRRSRDDQLMAHLAERLDEVTAEALRLGG
ncbi:tyrosine-type recombinase/integrase [Mycobacteroides abscessus]|uniref:tyrosine-type recombinase/integrase n=1 Tax=Mycobacteroides abscessus TaxID=36809 RepID=UPI00160003A9|nr:site-specific integrase [Mycobacteroides abscessus]